MLNYDAQRSEFAIATGRERFLFIVVLVLCATGALMELFGARDPRGLWLGGAVVAMGLTPFVPNSRWRIGLSLVAVVFVVSRFIF